MCEKYEFISTWIQNQPTHTLICKTVLLLQFANRLKSADLFAV